MAGCTSLPRRKEFSGSCSTRVFGDQTGSKLDIEGLWETETPGKPASTELLSRLPTLLNALCETHNTLGFPAYIVLDDRQIRVKQVFPIFEGEIVR